MSRQFQKYLLRRVFIPILSAVGILGLSAGGRALALQVTGKIHVVELGILYRSAQFDGDDLAVVLAKYHIRTAINLRGTNKGEPWHEKRIAGDGSTQD